MFLSLLARGSVWPSAPPRRAIRRRRRASTGGGGYYSSPEVLDTGHRFFGSVSRGLAQIVERAGSQFGLPNGYILGQEAGGAVAVGLRYGEGVLYTKNAGDLRVFWQGPSVGFDLGGEGARTMMLIYSLPATEAIYQRFAGVDGSAYFVGGLGMTALDLQPHRRGPDPHRHRNAARRQCRLSQVYAVGDLESVLSGLRAYLTTGLEARSLRATTARACGLWRVDSG